MDHKSRGSKRRDRFHAILRRLLTLGSLTIILGTFIIRDAMRENARELRDALANASNAYLTQKSIIETRALIREMAEASEPPGPVLGRYTQEFDESLLLFKDVNRLADLIPRPNEVTAHLQKVEAAYAAHNEEIEKIAAAGAVNYPKGTSEQEMFNREMDVAYKLNHSTDKFIRLINAETQAVFEIADAAATKADNEYYKWTKAFYVLFGVGWLLAVCRVLLGVKSVGEELED